MRKVDSKGRFVKGNASFLNKTHTPEARKKMSLAHKLKKRRYPGWKPGLRKGAHHTPEALLKMRQAKRGKYIGTNNPNWRGGIYPRHLAIRKSREYKLWRIAVYERDNYTCQICGDDKGGNLQADHIKPFSLFPELRFAINNGRTLCKPCHLKYGWHYRGGNKPRKEAA